jgi:hypothetical protein
VPACCCAGWVGFVVAICLLRIVCCCLGLPGFTAVLQMVARFCVRGSTDQRPDCVELCAVPDKFNIQFAICSGI